MDKDRLRHKSPFREPLSFSVVYFFATHRWLKPILIALAIGGLAFEITWAPPYMQQYLTDLSDLLFDPRYAGLVGVLIGGGIAGLVSYYLQLDQLKAEALASRRSRVYELLYDGLVKFKEQIRQKPFPWPICLKRERRSILEEARFDQWTQIKQDNRYIEVPKWLARTLDTFVEDIEIYLREWEKVSRMLEDKLIATLIEQGFLEEARGFGALGAILREEYETIVDAPFGMIKYVSKEAGQKFESESKNLLPRICKEYGKLEEVQSLRHVYRELIEEHTDWLIWELERIISYIDMRYGGQSGLL